MTQQSAIKDTEKPTRSWSQLEIDNAYLKQQNELLNKELSFTRYTINALKGIAVQKESTLNETRQELERALQHIQLLSYTLREQQKRNSFAANPTLIQDNDLSDDLSEEDELLEQQKRPVNIMSKLPLRRQQQVFVNENMMMNF